jgi:predicted transporter
LLTFSATQTLVNIIFTRLTNRRFAFRINDLLNIALIIVGFYMLSIWNTYSKDVKYDLLNSIVDPEN